MSIEKREKGGIVGFRLKAKHFKKLASRASRAGTSHHHQAQIIVESALDEREEEALLMRVELDDLRAELEAIRAGLVTMFSNFVARSSNGKTTIEAARSDVERVFARSDKR